MEEAETLGLKVTVKHVYSDALAGTVVEQSIAQDTVVTTGAEIVLTVSDRSFRFRHRGIPGGGVRTDQRPSAALLRRYRRGGRDLRARALP